MKTYLECVPCFLSQTLDACRHVAADHAVRERVLRRVLSHATGMSFDRSPPEMGATIHGIIREETGNADPYRRVKRLSNQVALDMLPELRGRVANAEDPLGFAVRLAIAGNIMDFAIVDRVDEKMLRATVEDTLARPLAVDRTAELLQALDGASSILVLGDNAGEIVFDRLLLEGLPAADMTYAVRGAPVINDATRQDAIVAGISEVARVIDSGVAIPGTVFDECSASFRRAYLEADVVIAKGQGNYETLSAADREVFFLLKAKCPISARDLGCEVGDVVVARRAGPKVRPATARG